MIIEANKYPLVHIGNNETHLCKNTGKYDCNETENKFKMFLDIMCLLIKIIYPQGIDLLNEVREKL